MTDSLLNDNTTPNGETHLTAHVTAFYIAMLVIQS